MPCGKPSGVMARRARARSVADSCCQARCLAAPDLSLALAPEGAPPVGRSIKEQGGRGPALSRGSRVRRGARRGARADHPSSPGRSGTLAGVWPHYEPPIFARQVASAARRRSWQGRRAGEVRAQLEARVAHRALCCAPSRERGRSDLNSPGGRSVARHCTARERTRLEPCVCVV